MRELDSFLHEDEVGYVRIEPASDHLGTDPRTVARLLDLYETHGAVEVVSGAICPNCDVVIDAGHDRSGRLPCDLCEGRFLRSEIKNEVVYRAKVVSNYFSHGFGVIVGVGADLPTTAADAEGIAEVLRDPGRCAYPVDQVTLLTGRRAARSDILAALDGLAARCRSDPEATAVVFFSGHGGYRPDEDSYYLQPFDFDEAGPANSCISAGTFVEKIAAIEARRLVVLLDCCHSGGLAQAKGPRRSEPLPPGLTDRLLKASGRAVIASCRPGELSWTGTPYSAFTCALLEGLAGYGSHAESGLAQLIDVVRWLGLQVPARTGGKQNPILDFAQVTVDFPLAYYSGGQPGPKRFDWSTAKPTSSVPPSVGPLVPGPVQFINALCTLLPGQFETVITGLELNPADVGGADQRAQSNRVYHLAKQARRLDDLRGLVRELNPNAFAP